MGDEKQLTSEYKGLDIRQTLFNAENKGKKLDKDGATVAGTTIAYLLSEVAGIRACNQKLIVKYTALLAKLDADAGITDTDYASLGLPL